MHIHTCLSPCADIQMSPKRIAEHACKKGMDIIAICDHNSAENAAAAVEIGKEKGLTVLSGMEVCSKEEVHIIALFQRPDQAAVLQEYVYGHLKGENKTALFGEQIVVNSADEVVSENERLLIGATSLDVHDIVDTIHAINGLCIASHVDRQAYGIIGQLGFIPENLALDGLELSARIEPATAKETIPGIDHWPCITASDAHYLTDIGNVYTLFEIAEPSVSEIQLALKNTQGRKIRRLAGLRAKTT